MRSRRYRVRVCVASVVGALLPCVALAQPLAEEGEGELADRSPDGVWSSVAGPVETLLSEEAWVRPESFRAVRLDEAAIRQAVAGAPLEGGAAIAAAPVRVTLPTPGGGFEEFDIVESPVMAAALQARYPEIRTYLGIGVDDPSATARLSLTPAGFAGQVLAPGRSYWIDRLNREDDGSYAVYTRADMDRPAWTCGVEGHDHGPVDRGDADADGTPRANALLSGEQLRTYRIAIAATGEYTQFHGGTVASGLAAIVVAMNRVNGIYESEIAVRMTLIANNDQLIFTNPSTDPFSNFDAFALLGQNQSALDSIVGNGAYDVGHNFSTGGGGVASLGSVCVSNRKAQGVTGLPQPTGDVFWVDYAAHELGHQFGANHTFNGVNGSCSGGNRNGSTAYEPGSATTIMGYAGICGNDNVQPNSDAFFHSISFDEMRAFITSGAGASCAVVTSTGNLPPTVDAGPDYAIPTDTPFTLTASGSDPNGDPLTFAWEQRDLGPAAALSAPDDGQIPLFRAFDPTVDPSRTFPRLSTVLAGTTDVREKLPQVGRLMDMRVTARDNRAGGGGVAFDEMRLNVVGSAGPFRVIEPAPGADWGGFQVVQWDVAGTDAAPISTSAVEIALSLDNGQTFSTILASNTPNDGFELVELPSVQSSSARVRVRPVDNVYFAVSRPFTVDVQPLTVGLPSGVPSPIAPGVPTAFDVVVAAGSEGIQSGSERLFVSIDGGAFTSAPLTLVSGNDYVATLPPLACGETASFYVEAIGTGGTVARFPTNAPTDTLTAEPGETVVSFADDFQTDLGWTVSSTATDGQWTRGVPANGDRGDPPADADGSGICWVTDNVPGNSDVDNGSTTLTSPPLDLTGGGTISFAYWLNDIPTGELNGDFLRVEYSSTNGASWSTRAEYTTAAAAWRSGSFEVPATLGNDQGRVRFVVADAGSQNVVEAGIDAFEISRFECTDPPGCPGDTDGSGTIDGGDLLAVINAFGSTSGGPGDVTGDGVVDGGDLLVVINAFGSVCPGG